jgi:hypothetical protein
MLHIHKLSFVVQEADFMGNLAQSLDVDFCKILHKNKIKKYKYYIKMY